MDFITLYFILMNYSVVGMLSIFTTISHSVQKCYHIILSAFVGSFLIRIFPEVTGWIILAVLVVWDLIAVLTPFGPLKLLVETAYERAMIELNPDHSLSLEYISTGQTSHLDSPISAQSVHSLVPESDDEEYEGSTLGLGDFIFFGILLGKVSLLEDMNALFACYVSIILGFLITYLILIILGQALPALPISLILGLIVYFSFVTFTSPYLNYLTANKLII
ncbi:LOW QUALITY PROTEIN: hypothetical protein MXB_3324 [Myxobolus squamalis]|nr:LOW QUALITY PROTEIN: hypothetical protein MXB_3324 [Myxobolus squamalis]